MDEARVNEVCRQRCPGDVLRRAGAEDDKPVAEALARVVHRAEKDRATIGVCALRPHPGTGRVCERLVLARLDGRGPIHRHRHAILLARRAELVLEVWVAARRVECVASAAISRELTSPAADAPGKLRLCLVGVGSLARARVNAADDLADLLLHEALSNVVFHDLHRRCSAPSRSR